MTSHATTDRSSSHQSTSGTGDDARSEGLLIRPTVSLLAAPSSVANLACFGGHHSNGPLFYFRNLSLFAPIKSFFRLLRNSGKKSTANQTGFSRVSLLFGKDLPQVTIRLYARSRMSMQHQRLIGWCHSHPFGLSHRCTLRSHRPTCPIACSMLRCRRTDAINTPAGEKDRRFPQGSRDVSWIRPF